MTRAAGLTVLALSVAACGDVTRPDRTDTYAFSIDCSIDGLCADQAGDLELIFRWPREALPVRIWVQPGSGLGPAVANAIELWERLALYGEFRAGFVRDSAAADVIFLRGDPVTISGGSNGGATPIDCLGETRFVVASADTSMVLPFLTRISPRAGQQTTDLDVCFVTVAAHELGHSLGLFLESPDPADLMHGRPRQPRHSARDVASFTRLYHTRPSVRLPAGR